MKLEIEIDASTAVHLLAIQSRTLSIDGASETEINALEQLCNTVCHAIDKRDLYTRQALAASVTVIP